MGVLEHFNTCKTLHDYLKTLPNSALDDLYKYPAACLAIFREFPKLAKHYVQRLLYVERPVPQAVVESWSLKEYKKEHLKAVETLSSLKIWNECSISGGLLGWMLNHQFRHSLKVALLGGGKPWTASAKLDVDSKQKSIKDLDTYALSRWEALLHFLAHDDKQPQDDSVSKDTILTLTHAGLMKTDNGDNGESSRPSITNEGFQFLLLDTASQVWYFITKYLEKVEDYNMNLVECLAFLFSLSLGNLGKDYSTEGFSDSMQSFMQHLREFGLLYQRSRKVQRFYPTQLAINFYSTNRRVTLDTEKHKTGFIVIETNYRVYAYTDSELQLALVGMFTDILYRFPNLAVGVVTRESVREALRNGITAEQIISFLNMHAHPEMIKTASNPSSPLPPTVVDQIKLWELERNRLTFTEGVLYNIFLSAQDYEVVKDYAQETGVLLHCSDQKRTVVVHKDGHESVRKFWKRHSKGQ